MWSSKFAAKCWSDQKKEYYKNKKNLKRSILIDNVNINNIIVSSKTPFEKKGFKYFINYKDCRKFRPLCIILQKVSAYRRGFHETKYISFSIKGDEFLEKYNKIWHKVSNSMKKRFNSELTYNKKYLNTKTKSYEPKTITYFHGNKVPKKVLNAYW